MESFLRDLRYVSRGLVRTPGFLLVTALTLALGIGATTSIFSVVHGVLLRPLPYPEPERIVQLWQVNGKSGQNQIAEPNFRDWQARSRSFARLALFADGGIASVAGAGEPVRVRTADVSRDFFDVLGVRPIAGRAFVEEELTQGGAPAVVVSHGFWRRQLAGERSAIGKTLTFGGQAYTIVGVMPPALDFPAGVDLWSPLEQYQRTTSRTAHNWLAIGRLNDGVAIEQAQREVSAISRQVKQEHGDKVLMTDAQLIPLREQMVGSVRPALVTLLAASAFLLLIACANVVNLMVARIAMRQGEIALRLAIGASRGRLVQQFLTESIVLALAGGALGVLLAAAGVRGLLALDPGTLPRVSDVTLDARVLLFALGVSVLTAVVLGLMAAFRGARGDLREALASSQRTLSGGGHRIRSTLVVAQVALTTILLVGAGLVGRSFVRLLDVDPGFRRERAVVLDVSVPIDARDPAEVARRTRFYDDLIARLGTLPGVRAAGGVNALPLTGGQTSNGTFIEMSSPTERFSMELIPQIMKDPTRAGHAEFRIASEGYFEAMKIPLVRGRLFDGRDAPDGQHVALVSASLARKEWPDANPIGKVIQFGNMDGDLRPFVVIGVVGDVREVSLASEPRPTFYAYYRQRPRAAQAFNVVVQGEVTPATVGAAARQIVRQLRPDVPPRLRTIETVIATSVADRRFMLVLLGAFGATALLLATLGVYSVIAYVVAQRKQEIGIRVALGARSADVLVMVLRQGAALALAGVGLGTLGALALTGTLQRFLYGVTTTDPVAFGGVLVGLTVVALLASLVPARRASKVEPMSVLRGS